MRTSISRLFCFGLGYMARHVVARLEEDARKAGIEQREKNPEANDDASGMGLIVHGTTRTPSQANEFLFDADHELSDAACEALQQADAVLITIPPDENGDRVFPLYKDFLEYMPHLKWVGYCSSVSVYGDHRGGWVDEKTGVNPITARARYRVKAEKQWLESGLPVHIFRLGGIYGEKRSALEQARHNMPIVSKPDHAMNRIHAVDAARAMVASMQQPRTGAIYNLCDDMPTSREDILRYAYEIQNLDAPETLLWNEADLSPKARSFFEECKRVRAELTKSELGLQWLYPNYLSGLDALLAQSTRPASALGINDNDITARRRIAE